MSRKELYLQVFNSTHEHVGHFDGEFFYTNPPINLRVDSDEVYEREAPYRHVGNLNSGRIELLDGSVPYYFVD